MAAHQRIRLRVRLRGVKVCNLKRFTSNLLLNPFEVLPPLKMMVPRIMRCGASISHLELS